MKHKLALPILCLLLFLSNNSLAQQRIPPYDLWTDDVLAQIRDPKTLDYQIEPHLGYADVYFTSNPSASYFDAKPPYAEHSNEKIRIHAYLATPLFGGPYPALVIGHGHGGKADLTLTQAVAALGYVALSIDGPQAGLSTGGPQDENQAWISVDKGPQYGFLYHWAYAGMRALTVLEELARQPGNPHRIDANRLGALGASMGGLLTTYMNGLDSRMKAAVIIVSAGNWPHAVRYPNGWLYHGLYAGTRDTPYNGSDPLNSIENVDSDPTAITFMNYFDPIRYAPRQHAPVLTVIGTHDEYFPLPGANLQQLAFVSAGTQTNFEKRLWLVPNAPHNLETPAGIASLVGGLYQWLQYSFGKREKPLATPLVSLFESAQGLRFEVRVSEPSDRPSAALVELYVGTRVDSTVTPIKDFQSYPALREGDRFVVRLPAGEKTASGEVITADNAIYFATVTDLLGLPVSSLVSRGREIMDLSTNFVPVIEQWPGDKIVAPVPPPPVVAAETVSSSIPVTAGGAYQGMALSNPTDRPKSVRVEARTPDGRIAAAEGLINPVFLSVPPRTQQVFVNHQWLGPGALLHNGSLHAMWSDTPPTSLSFRGSDNPRELDGIGPAAAPARSLWLPLAPEQDPPAANRRLRIFGGSAAADVQILFRNRFGNIERIPASQVKVPAGGTVDIIPPSGAFEALVPASAEIQATNPVSARLEVSGARDTWSIEARSVPAATRYYQPHTEWNGEFSTRLLFLNPSASTREVRPHLLNRNGSEIGPSNFFVLNPFAVQSFTVESLFPVSGIGRGAGWIEIESTGGPVVCVALATNSFGATASSALDAAGAGSWSMPFYVESSAYWTGLAIANVGDKPSGILITALDRTGNPVGRWTENINPRESQTKLVWQWIKGLPQGTTGQIVITTGEPAALLAYFGMASDALAAIPFTWIAP